MIVVRKCIHRGKCFCSFRRYGSRHGESKGWLSCWQVGTRPKFSPRCCQTQCSLGYFTPCSRCPTTTSVLEFRPTRQHVMCCVRFVWLAFFSLEPNFGRRNTSSLDRHRYRSWRQLFASIIGPQQSWGGCSKFLRCHNYADARLLAPDPFLDSMLRLQARIESDVVFIELGLLYLRDLWYDEVTYKYLNYRWAWLPPLCSPVTEHMWK